MGSALGDPENDYQITDGWFANITSILDVDGNLVDPRVDPGHNMYNYIAAEYDYTVSAFVLMVVHEAAPSNDQVVDLGESVLEMMPDGYQISAPYYSGDLLLHIRSTFSRGFRELIISWGGSLLMILGVSSGCVRRFDGHAICRRLGFPTSTSLTVYTISSHAMRSP